MVPVLSLHRTSIPAASSIADRRVISTPDFASSNAPIAVATVNVAGNATGTLATSRISVNGITSANGRCDHKA